jgi:hypothetical protein
MGVCNKRIRIRIPPLPFLRVDFVLFATVLTHLWAFVSDVVREISFRAERHWNRMSLPPTHEEKEIRRFCFYGH